MRVLALLLSLGLFAPAPVATPAVDDHMRQFQAQARLPGLAFAIVHGDQVVHSRAWGTDGDGAPVTSRTPFLLGSVSKPVTAMAVQQLADAGRIGLDTPVRTYLPWFRVADASASERITVRHLLTHTSGLTRWASRTDRFDNSPDGLARSVRDLAGAELAAAPGAGYRYTAANYMVLGAMVEAVTGRPYGAHLRQAVFDPLGMRDAAATPAEAADVPAGHRFHFGHPRRFDPPYDGSGVPYGYVAAGLDDMTRFASAHLRNGYRLGWRESVLDGSDTRQVWHAGATPGYFSHVVLAPGRNLAVVVLANAYGLAHDQQLAAAAFNLVRLSEGRPPVDAGPDRLFTTILAVAALLLAGLGALIVRTLRQPGPVRVRGTLAWLAGCFALIAAALWAVPASLGGSLGQSFLWALDVGQALVAVAVLAGLLALARLTRHRRGTIPR